MAEKNAARVAIRLNGILIHDNFKLPLRRHKYATFKAEPTSPIVLQEHGSPVKFRNIWLIEKKNDKADSKKEEKNDICQAGSHACVYLTLNGKKISLN